MSASTGEAVATALGGLNGGRSWFYLARTAAGPALVLVPQADDPRGQALAAGIRAIEGVEAGARGLAMPMAEGLRFVSRDPLPDALDLLTAWWRGQRGAAPGVDALRGSAFQQVDTANQPVDVQEDPARWALPEAPAAPAAPPLPPELQALQDRALEQLAAGGPWWFWLGDHPSGLCLVLSARGADPRGQGLAEGRAAATAAGAGAGQAAQGIAQVGPPVSFTSRQPWPGFVPALVGWVRRAGEAAAPLREARFVQVDTANAVVDTQDDPAAWGEAAAPPVAAAPGAAPAGHDPVSTLAGAAAGAWHWFWLAPTDPPRLALIGCEADPKRVAFEAAVAPLRREGEAEVVGRAALLGDGRWAFRSLADHRGAAAALARWAAAAGGAAPGALAGLRFQHMSAEGHLIREELADQGPGGTAAVRSGDHRFAPGFAPPAPAPAPASPAPAPASPAPAAPAAPAPAPAPAPAAPAPAAPAAPAASPATLRRRAGRPAPGAAPRELLAWLGLMEQELAAGGAAAADPDPALLDALRGVAAACAAWLPQIKGPPFACRTALGLPALPAPAGPPPATAAALAGGASAALRGLREVAARLDSYAQYRSGFPPPLREGYDARLGELLSALSALAAALDAAAPA
jgi:hypothetical protein